MALGGRLDRAAEDVRTEETNQLGNHVTRSNEMGTRIRDLIRKLEAAGFEDRGGKGDHRNFVHSRVAKLVTISGKQGDDAKQYQIKAVNVAIEESKK